MDENLYKEIIKRPSVLLPKKHIILISHMRANTTLLGHIFGSHPNISGYYEQHIGYYSWKSLIRKKIKFAVENPKEPTTQFYFDKVLHNEHEINDKIFKLKNLSFIFMLRQPERTIKSIVKLFSHISPDHDFASVECATDYYCQRLQQMSELALNCAKKNQIYYLDAELIVSQTENTLDMLSKWFSLSPKLNSEYRLFDLSGQKRYGDPSANIRSGYVRKNTDNYEAISIDEHLLDKANTYYVITKHKMLALTNNKITL